MGTKYWKVVCDEHGIDGSGDYCCGKDAHPGRINVFYHEALGGSAEMIEKVLGAVRTEAETPTASRASRCASPLAASMVLAWAPARSR
jgi:hypothetical protein